MNHMQMVGQNNFFRNPCKVCWDTMFSGFLPKSKMAAAHGLKGLPRSFLFSGTILVRSERSVLVSRKTFSIASCYRQQNATFISALRENSKMTGKRQPEAEIPTPKRENPLDHPDYFQVHNMFTMREMFDARVHLGHHEGCWNPLMRPYIYGSREHFHIIDLNQTVEHTRLALNVLAHIAFKNGTILFISTHPQFEELTQKTARDCNEYFVTRRWRGGTFTNSHMLGLRKNPDFVVFLHLPSLGRNLLAVKEAAQCNIPSIGIVDTDCNPNLITYPIPGNDDSPSSVELYCKLFKEAVLRGKGARNDRRFQRRNTDD